MQIETLTLWTCGLLVSSCIGCEELDGVTQTIQKLHIKLAFRQWFCNIGTPGPASI
jgi:hypothetical protein